MVKFFQIMLMSLVLLLMNCLICTANELKPIVVDTSHVDDGWNAKNIAFADEVADIDYEFSKAKKIFVSVIDVSIVNDDLGDVDKVTMNTANETNVKKKMKLKLVDKEQADLLMEVIIEKWECVFDHRVPERVAYEAYESFEGYKTIEPSFFERTEWERRARRARKEGRNPPPRPRPHQEWTVSSSRFPNSRRVVTPYYRSEAHKISSSSPFANSEKVTYPAYDAFASSVVATFNLRNARSNEIVLSRKGAYTNVSGSKNKQATVYDTICTAFCKQYKSTIKQIKKLKKENKISQ
ncbi:MAG: hypothetical protein J6H31_06110 [Butyrivibrio sp.]|nr:hypothetical protein [Butyrivibrio sp.]